MGDRTIRGARRRGLNALALVVPALLAIWSPPALAWWDYGHRTVASIALENVRPRTRARIAALLKSDAQLGTPQCRVRSIQDAAVWPDCIRKEKWRWDYTFTWHFQDIQICQPFDIKQDCANGTCITAQIDRNARILKDKSLPVPQRLEALAFLVHFVGDIHQPLHGSDNHDAGGNGVKSGYGMVPGKNLHSVWDGLLAERAISSARPPLVRRYSETERAALATGVPEDWLRESWQISRDFIYPRTYGGPVPCEDAANRPAAWTEAQTQAAIPIVDKRIEQAGLRLAQMLDAALG